MQIEKHWDHKDTALCREKAQMNSSKLMYCRPKGSTEPYDHERWWRKHQVNKYVCASIKIGYFYQLRQNNDLAFG